MTNKISFPRVIGASLLTVAPLFSAYAAGTTPEKPVVPVVNETTKLKLMASSYTGNGTVSITTDIIGLSNCKKMAEAFAETIVGVGFGSPTVRAVCTHAEGSAPIARIQCSRKSNWDCRPVDGF